MALYQPTNIIPSSFTVGVVDAAQDIAQISWQVNGNSAMTAFEIKFMQNNTFSTQITSTDKVPVTGGFFGTDRFGRPKTFTWTAGNGNPQTWSEFFSAFKNGGSFKFKITQYWQEGGTEKSIEQIESSVFITRDRPVCEIQRSATENFANPMAFPSGSTLPASIGYFVGAYSQAQGAPVRDVRWQVATWVNGAAGDILADTGDVDTPTLEYSFNGFFIGNSYAVRCSGKADYQTYGTQDFDSRWTYFTAQIPANQKQSDYTGNFTVQCLPKENAALLRWEAVEVISPKITPDGANPSTTGGSVSLPSNSSITWNTKGVGEQQSAISFTAPWTVAFKFKPKKVIKEQIERISGTTTNERTVTFSTGAMTRRPDSDPVKVRDNWWEAKFTIVPKKPFVEFSRLKTDFQVELVGAPLVDFSIQLNDDGSDTITTYSYSRPSGARISAPMNAYYYEREIELPAEVAAGSTVELGENAIDYSLTYSGKTLTVIVYRQFVRSGSPETSVTVTAKYYMFLEETKILEVGGNNLTVAVKENGLSVYNNGSQIADYIIKTSVNSVAVVCTPNEIYAFSYFASARQDTYQSTPVSYSQKAIDSVSVYGGQNGTTIDAVSVYQGNGANILSLYDDADFEPIWNDVNYELYMTANFNGNLEGGTGTASGNGFRIYRQEVGGNILTPIADVKSTTTSLKDYGLRSRKSYKYSLYAYDSNQAFMSSVESETVVATCFKNYSLLVCDYDSERDAYHVRKQYLFALNLSAGSEGNNNAPTLNKNFTPYPTRMPDTSNYISGTLQGLIGVIYTVPALVEQVGGFKYTAKPSTLDYFDSVDLEKELYDLSVAPYQLFLRDMAGHLRMISTSNQINMTPDIKKRQIPKTISFPWAEIGDASDVTIIQTPDDYGWNNDNQLLDVRLDVDPATGILSAFYPKPYEGTRFYLTGAQREILGAKTPIGVTPAKIEMSDTAEQPQDGTVTATVKVNREEGD